MSRREAPELRDGVALIGGVPAGELAERHGTPLYAIDARIVDENLARVRGACAHPRVRVLYSAKANPSVGLLRRLRAQGAGLDACSPGDLAFAAAAGFTGDEISYTGHGMSDRELEAVAASGAAFTADSLSQVERAGASGRFAEIGLRLNCGIEAGFHPHVMAGARPSKFGVHLVQLAEAAAAARRHGMRIAGVHGHLGSDVTTPEPHLRLLDALLDAATQLPDVRWVNVGGGFGDFGADRYDFDAFGAEADRRLAAAEARLGRPLELRAEPGGYLVLNAGCLLARVTELKPSVEVDGSATPAFVATDTSHNHLVSAVVYGAEHPMWLADRAGAAPAGRFHVTGNLMQAGDLLARDRPLPQPRPGDVLVIGRCGGYAAWRAPAFNERPRPAEVLVEDGSVTVLRRAETESELLAREIS